MHIHWASVILSGENLTAQMWRVLKKSHPSYNADHGGNLQELARKNGQRSPAQLSSSEFMSMRKTHHGVYTC